MLLRTFLYCRLRFWLLTPRGGTDGLSFRSAVLFLDAVRVRRVAPRADVVGERLELLLEPVQLLVGHLLDIDQPVGGALDGCQQLVELDLDRARVLVLGV